MGDRIKGYCPMGCGETLFVGEGGFITCSRLGCPHPDAVADILGERETEHIVDFRVEEFTVLHPLKERLNSSLFACDLHAAIASMSGPPPQLGRFRATRVDDDWQFQAVTHD